MAEVTITIPDSDWSDSSISIDWNPSNNAHITLGSTLSVGGSTELFLGRFILPRIPSSTIGIQLSDGTGGSEAGLGPEFSDQMENSGTITILASNGDSLTVTGISDSSEPYVWNPSNIADVNTFANTLQGLADQSLTVTFNDNAVVNTAEVIAAAASGVPTVAAQVRTSLALTLADIAIPDGRVLVGTASLIGVGASGDVYNTSDATVITGPDPPNLGAANLNATRIYVTPNPQLRISEDGAGDIEAIFAAGGAQADYQFHIQTSPTDVLSYGSSDIDATRSTGARLLIGTNNDPLGLLDPISALASGDRVIWFLTEPSGERVRAAATSGAPNATAQVRTTLPLTERIRATASPGAPVAAARVRTTPPPQRIQAGASSGAPTVAAQVRTFHPGIRRVRAAISTGAPVASARVRTILPGSGRIQAAAITSGVPIVRARVRTAGFGAQHFPRFGFNGNGVGFGQGPFASAFQFRRLAHPRTRSPGKSASPAATSASSFRRRSRWTCPAGCAWPMASWTPTTRWHCC